MSTQTPALVRRGETQYGVSGTINTSDYGSSVGVEGALAVFDYTDPSNKTHKDSRKVHAIYVRNVMSTDVNSGLMLPGNAVTWASGFRDKRVDAYSFVAAEEIAGIVDDRLPAAGVRHGDMFWLIIKGPTRGYLSSDTTTPAKGTAAFVIDDLLIAGLATSADKDTYSDAGKLSALWATWLAETNGSNELVTNVARNGVGRATQTTAASDTGLRNITINIRP